MRLFFLVILGILPSLVWAQERFDVDPKNGLKNITGYAKFASVSDGFKFKLQNPDLHLTSLSWSYSNDKKWIVVPGSNKDQGPLEVQLGFDSYLTGTVEFYLLQNNEIIELQKGGSATHPSTREVQGLISGFIFKVPPGNFEILLGIQSRHNFSNQLIIGSPHDFQKSESERRAIVLIFVGALFFLIIYNLVIAVYLKSSVYAWYVLFNISMLFTTSILNGLVDYFPQPSNWIFSEHLMIFSCLAAILNLQFMLTYLDMQFHNPKTVKLFRMIQLACLILIFWHITPLETLTFGAKNGFIIDAIIAIEVAFMLVIPSIYFYKKNKAALFYLLGWIAIGASVLLFLLAHYNFIQNTELIRSSLLYGTGLQMLLLSLGLAYKFKELQIQLITVERKALSSDKYRRLTRVLLHDLGNPLTIIGASAKALSNPNIKIQPEVFAQKINRALENITKIIDHVRKGVIADVDNQDEEIQTLSLYPILQESLFIFEERLKEKQIQIQIDVNPEIKVMAEKSSLLNDVINNVISNAIKFSHPNSTIEIYENDDSSWYILKIKDKGIGMPSELVSSISIEDTVKSRKGTSGEKGTGFGMYLVRSYMKLYGGKMKIISKEKTSENSDSFTEVQLYFKVG